MIVGFPGETEAEFSETLSLAEAVRFHSMFSFKYSERPNTLAAKRLPDDVPEDVKTRRIRGLQMLQRRIQQELHASLVGERVEVLVDSRSRRRDWELSGRTTGNTVVNFPGRPDWVGRCVEVAIQRAGPHSVWGEVVAEPARAGGDHRPEANEVNTVASEAAPRQQVLAPEASSRSRASEVRGGF
jgi:tRNA-2-methylthio-N6-dimethylallyladenosine synthase